MTGAQLYLNGRFSALEDGRIDVEDRGFQFGDAVYEVVRVMNGRLVFLEEHRERLCRSLEEVHMKTALSGHSLPSIASQLVDRSSVMEGILYVQVSRGSAPRDLAPSEGLAPTVLAYVRPASLPDEEELRTGVRAHLVEDLRWARCDIKSTDLLPAVMAKREAQVRGAHEALFVGAGSIREGTSSNFFGVIDGALRTHPANNRILDGITRRKVLELAWAGGIPVREEAVRLDELPRVEEAFLTSTVRDVSPVVRIGTEAIGGGRPGTTTLRLADGLRHLLAREAGGSGPAPLAGESSP